MQPDLIPFHCYYSGDAFCTVVMANKDHTFSEFAEMVADLVCGYRVDEPKNRNFTVTHEGNALDMRMTVRDSKLAAFERVDVVCD